MIRTMNVFKSEYHDFALCSFEYEQHGSFACPYKTPKTEPLSKP